MAPLEERGARGGGTVTCAVLKGRKSQAGRPVRGTSARGQTCGGEMSYPHCGDQT